MITSTSATEVQQWFDSFVNSNHDVAVALAASDFFAEQDQQAESIYFRSLAEPVKIGTKQLRTEIVVKDSLGRKTHRITYASKQAGWAATWKSAVYRDKPELAIQYISNILYKIDQRKAKAVAKRATIDQLMADWKNPYNVGDLLYYSYGYDETHYTFAEIISVGKKTVVVREVSRIYTSADTAMYIKVQPKRGDYTSEPKTCRITFAEHGGQLHSRLCADDRYSWSLVKEGQTFSESY
jgi:hypothetical protein